MQISLMDQRPEDPDQERTTEAIDPVDFISLEEGKEERTFRIQTNVSTEKRLQMIDCSGEMVDREKHLIA